MAHRSAEAGELCRAREQEDRRITAYVVSLDEAALDGVISDRRVSSPEVKVQAVAPGLAHWFNHQTHHRAQVHTMLTSLAGKAPSLDLLVYQRMWAEGLR
ncbi:DinB family protein [Paraburkholderia sp. BL10I2N1]|uniref:DinB family protein n=1 Tax=Paraburkholderia sp. BL10I2N1 TaxID=1938796 RepID=UPI00105FA493|nr:DinB family protein [Paraburkholderia sp. BL10I2N1]